MVAGKLWVDKDTFAFVRIEWAFWRHRSGEGWKKEERKSLVVKGKKSLSMVINSGMHCATYECQSFPNSLCRPRFFLFPFARFSTHNARHSTARPSFVAFGSFQLC